MSNPFEDLDQPELEILALALDQLNPMAHFLPQHEEAMDRVRGKLYVQVRDLQRASVSSRDGSWFDDEAYRGKL
jgi:hypothetical protein